MVSLLDEKICIKTLWGLKVIVNAIGGDDIANIIC